MVLNPAGEDVLVLCERAATRRTARSLRSRRPAGAQTEPLPVEEVATPDTTTIAALAAFLRIDACARRQGRFFVTATAGSSRRSCAATTRSTRPSSPTPSRPRRPAAGARTRKSGAAGMEPGYGSPIGAPATHDRGRRCWRRARRISSPARTATASTCATSTSAATSCPTRRRHRERAGGRRLPDLRRALVLRNGIEVGNIFKLGTKYTRAVRCDATSATPAQEHPIVMGSYGIGARAERACIVEAHHDDKGIVWPARSHRTRHTSSSLGAKRPPGRPRWPRRSTTARAAGRELLYDDRDESPGVKFTDAELLGLPWI